MPADEDWGRVRHSTLLWFDCKLAPTSCGEAVTSGSRLDHGAPKLRHRQGTTSREYVGKNGSHLGTVEAARKRQAVAEAAEEFNIPPARHNKIVVIRLDPNR